MKLADVYDRLAEEERRERRRMDRLYYRIRTFPQRLERVRTRMAILEREAAELGMTDLL